MGTDLSGEKAQEMDGGDGYTVSSMYTSKWLKCFLREGTTSAVGDSTFRAAAL